MANLSDHELVEHGASWLVNRERLDPWRSEALCADEYAELDWFFPDKANQLAGAKGLRRARLFCARCPVRYDCLETALRTESDGVWGGTTLDEREATAGIEPLEERIRTLDHRFYQIVVRGSWRGVPTEEWRGLRAEGDVGDQVRATDVLGT